MLTHLLRICSFFIVVEAAEELIFSQVIFRHGERAPSDPFKNAPYKEDKWPMGMGHVTYRGIHNQFQLGRWLKKHYIDEGKFLSRNYNYTEIYVRSSDHSRAIQSAAAFVSGLYDAYPKEQSAIDVPDLLPGLIPIPINSVDASLDKANRPLPNCHRLIKLQYELISQSEQGHSLERQHSEFVERLTNLTGQTIGIYNSFQVADYIEAARRLNLTLPLWLEQSYDESKEIELKFLRLLTGIEMKDLELKKELQIGMGGNLLNELLDRMESKIGCLNAQNASKECTTLHSQKVYVYSSHDITLTGLFGALDMEYLDGDRDALPEFSSLLLIELLRQVDTNEFVWKYRRSSVLNGTLVELDVPYNTIETLRQRADMLKALPDPKTWCDNDRINIKFL